MVKRKRKTGRDNQVAGLLDWAEPIEENREKVHWASYTHPDGTVTHYRGETRAEVIAAAADHFDAAGINDEAEE